MSIEQRTVEVQQYIDTKEPLTITLIPSGYPGKFIEVMEDPFGEPTVRVTTLRKFKEAIRDWQARQNEAEDQ